jgi:hypothetical protein
MTSPAAQTIPLARYPARAQQQIQRPPNSDRGVTRIDLHEIVHRPCPGTVREALVDQRRQPALLRRCSVLVHQPPGQVGRVVEYATGRQLKKSW